MAKQIGVLSEDVKMYMEPLTSKRYCALTDRIINLLLKGNIDLSGMMHQSAKPATFSDSEIEELIEKETEVDLFIVDKNRTGAGVSFVPYLSITMFDLSKHGVFKIVGRKNYKHNCLPCITIRRVIGY